MAVDKIKLSHGINMSKPSLCEATRRTELVILFVNDKQAPVLGKIHKHSVDYSSSSVTFNNFIASFLAI